MDTNKNKADWRKRLQQLEEKLQGGRRTSESSKDTSKRVLPLGVRVPGSLGMSSTQKGKKHRPKTQSTKEKEELTVDNIVFEGLNGLDCRNWWTKTPHDDPIKKNVRQAQVHWAVQMPIFCIKDFEVVLCAMIGTYDRHLHQSVFDYQHQRITISFTTSEFRRVFGILGVKGKKIDTLLKITPDVRATLLQLLLRDNLTQAEKDSLKSVGKGGGVKKSFLAKGVWRCLLFVVKSRLIGSSRASDIAIAQIVLVNGLRNEVVYDWAP